MTVSVDSCGLDGARASHPPAVYRHLVTERRLTEATSLAVESPRLGPCQIHRGRSASRLRSEEGADTPAAIPESLRQKAFSARDCMRPVCQPLQEAIPVLERIDVLKGDLHFLPENVEEVQPRQGFDHVD